MTDTTSTGEPTTGPEPAPPAPKLSLLDRLLGRVPPGGPELTSLLESKTDEGSQELVPRSRTSRRELTLESGSVLRLPEGVQIDAMDLDVETPEDERMILNLGPSHPSTHGVLRVMVEIDGEIVLRSKPVVGYLHTGMEKTAEELMYHQGSTNVTRMDYLSPFFNELGFCLSVEKLLRIEIPPRATWIRMLMCELNRMSSHILWLATNGADLGALNMLVYGWREREMLLAFFEKVTGLRMNHNYIRPGGVAADLPDGWRDDCAPCARPCAAAWTTTTSCSPGSPSSREGCRGSAPWTPKQPSGSGSPGRCCARPGWPGICGATSRTWPTTTSSST